VSETDRRAIERTTAELLAAFNSADVDRVISVWAADGVLMPPNHPAVHGRAALEEYFRRVFERSKLEFTFTTSEIFVDGNTAIQRISYTVKGSVADRGKGVHVYRREALDRWRLALDIWNSDGAGHPASSSDGLPLEPIG
jgi:uncharacterized protein (TIGR02246 family)